ncbi:MAG TPA: hypothetical protein VH063_14125 [Gaiellaceae bacterium]|jgi:hypothetical protein|nr:hypothetical protein [Gaiellaceae bacterium]
MREGWQAVRRRLVPDSRGALAGAALLGVVLLLALSACGSSAKHAASTSVTTSTSSTPDTGCDTFGPTWVHTYNVKAIKQGNPIRMLSACCQVSGQIGVHHCFIKLTLAGTKDLGCETVDIGTDGLPAGEGKHEKCDVDT